VSRLTINLIGAGKVGQTLCRLFADQGQHDVQDVFGRDLQRTEQAVGFIGAGRAVDSLAALRSADIWLVTVPDTRIGEVVAELAAVAPAGPAVAFHCSGFLPAAELSPVRALGWQLASAHPVMSFADPATAIKHFPGCHCGLEGDAAAVETVASLLGGVGARTFPIETQGKALYHAAAVFSSNLAVVLQGLAREAWMAAGVPEIVARDLNVTLLKATVDNVEALGPEAALTGPAARGDWSVVSRQHQAVQTWHPLAGDAYDSLSLLARRLKRGGSTLVPVDEEG